MERSTPVNVLLSLGRKGFIICVILLSCLWATGYSSVQALPVGHTSSTAPKSSCTGASPQFDGADRYATGWGAWASVGDYQYDNVCSAEAAWSLIDEYSAPCGLAQSGYAMISDWSSAITYYFYEVEDYDCGIGPVMLGELTKNWGQSDTFMTYYNSGTGYFEPEINGTVEDYFYTTDWSANDQEWMGETHSDQDYVTGGTDHHTIFGSIQYLQNGAWHTINASSYMTNSTAYGEYSTTSGNQFSTWDTRMSQNVFVVECYS